MTIFAGSVVVDTTRGLGVVVIIAAFGCIPQNFEFQRTAPSRPIRFHLGPSAVSVMQIRKDKIHFVGFCLFIDSYSSLVFRNLLVSVRLFFVSFIVIVPLGDVGGGEGGLIETVVVSCAIGLFFDFVIFHF